MHKKKKKHFNRARMKVLTLPFGYHDGAKKLERSNLWTREPKKKKKKYPVKVAPLDPTQTFTSIVSFSFFALFSQ